MPKSIYALYDGFEQELHLFSEDNDIPEKDAVSIYIKQNIIPAVFHRGLESEEAQSLLNQISQTEGSIKLKEVLAYWDYTLKTLLV